MFDWWTDLLLHYGLIGPVLALGLVAFALLAAGLVIVWTLAALKWLGQQFMVGYRRSGPPDAQDPHQQLGVVDERPVDHR